MTTHTVGQVAAILAAAPAVDQITGPATAHDPTPTSRGTRHESTTVTERAARVALAQVGAGGGLKGHRMDNGWMFAPFTMFSSSLTPGTTWLVTHDGQVHDLSDVDGSPIVRG